MIVLTCALPGTTADCKRGARSPATAGSCGDGGTDR